MPPDYHHGGIKKDKQSCMRHSVLTCSVILPSIIKCYKWLLSYAPEMKTKEEYGSGDIISKQR